MDITLKSQYTALGDALNRYRLTIRVSLVLFFISGFVFFLFFDDLRLLGSGYPIDLLTYELLDIPANEIASKAGQDESDKLADLDKAFTFLAFVLTLGVAFVCFFLFFKAFRQGGDMAEASSPLLLYGVIFLVLSAVSLVVYVATLSKSPDSVKQPSMYQRHQLENTPITERFDGVYVGNVSDQQLFVESQHQMALGVKPTIPEELLRLNTVYNDDSLQYRVLLARSLHGDMGETLSAEVQKRYYEMLVFMGFLGLVFLGSALTGMYAIKRVYAVKEALIAIRKAVIQKKRIHLPASGDVANEG